MILSIVSALIGGFFMFNLKNNKPTSSKMEVVELKPQAEKQANSSMKV